MNDDKKDAIEALFMLMAALVFFICIICFIICPSYTGEMGSGTLVTLENGPHYDIVYDKDTGVMYYRSRRWSHQLYVLYDADGKPRVYPE